jgi:hypothetical protein
MIRLKKLNIVKEVSTEYGALALERQGYKRIPDPQPAKAAQSGKQNKNGKSHPPKEEKEGTATGEANTEGTEKKEDENGGSGDGAADHS